ncbi:hypothetical protein WUBG_04810, partial [Wuchereria bancrofti]
EEEEEEEEVKDQEMKEEEEKDQEMKEEVKMNLSAAAISSFIRDHKIFSTNCL